MKFKSRLAEGRLRESVSCECDFPSCPVHGTDPCPNVASSSITMAGIGGVRVCEKCRKAYEQEMRGF